MQNRKGRVLKSVCSTAEKLCTVFYCYKKCTAIKTLNMKMTIHTQYFFVWNFI